MKRSNIGKALVYHSFSREYSPVLGNQKLLEEIGKYKNLYPCWVLFPHYTGEMPVPEELINVILEKGIRAVRIFPKTHKWSLSEWSAGVLLKILEKRSIPLFIDFEETNFDQLNSVCSGHPNLPVVLTRAPFRLNRDIYALLSETSNLYIDTSFFQLYYGIEDVCEKFGANRLLFGSATPFFDPAPLIMVVKYARISKEEKAMIAGGNLMQLLGF
ncbi:MAG: amidohydrolase family protein [Candidatus Cloacimonetes bacterium]|nr:amidohydrolase family protein [Candidatus Cloacimonadota bacterium]